MDTFCYTTQRANLVSFYFFMKMDGYEYGRSPLIWLKMSRSRNRQFWKWAVCLTFCVFGTSTFIILVPSILLSRLHPGSYTWTSWIVHFNLDFVRGSSIFDKNNIQRKFRSPSRSNSIFESDYGFNFDSNFQLFTLSTFCQGGVSKSCYLIANESLARFPMFWLA